MKSAFLIFPHQLFENFFIREDIVEYFLIEEYLFFKQYKFHKQKILFHRASMQFYQNYLLLNNINLKYIDTQNVLFDVRELIKDIFQKGVQKIIIYDVCDDWLYQRISNSCKKYNLVLEVLDSPLFLNSSQEIKEYAQGKKRYFQTEFYVLQRKTRKILVHNDFTPVGGKWTFDTENRLKYPPGLQKPKVLKHKRTEYHVEAEEYVNTYYQDNLGSLDSKWVYPVTFDQAKEAIYDFFHHRFYDFGIYEDAIVENENVLNHSVLSPLMNSGLLTAGFVISSAVDYGEKNQIPLNSIEGFIRQILGWREFIRMVYVEVGTKERTTNFWGFNRKIPPAFYTGNTGIKPFDKTIEKLLKTGYNHHIERLMILSNFMLLCEFDPNEIYQWFMEMYIDAYDWVMVPNVYGMGLYADGGLMSTKPYISGSNYISKMSDYKKDKSWSDIWDALFWRFLDVHRGILMKNPRMNMLVKTFDKWPDEKKADIHMIADNFFKNL